MLTKEEKKQVIQVVMESHQGATLSEVKSNKNLKEEINLNLEFYSNFKKHVGINESAIGSALSWIGNFKDFLTGSTVIKNIGDFIKKIWSKIKSMLVKVGNKYLPKPIASGVKLTAEIIKDYIEKKGRDLKSLIDWVAKTFSFKGISWLLAAVQNRTVRPTAEQRECLYPLAKKIVSVIYALLVIAFVAKIIYVIGLAIVSAPILGVAAGAGLKAFIVPVIGKIAGVSKGSALATKLIKASASTYSAVKKGIDAKEYGEEATADAEALADKIEKEGKLSWKELWNACSSDKDKELNEMLDFYNR